MEQAQLTIDLLILRRQKSRAEQARPFL